MRKTIIIIIVAIAWANVVSATTTTSKPTTTAPAVSKKVSAILDKLEKKRGEIKTLQADIVYELYESIPDDRTIQQGVLRYQAAIKKTPVKFMVHFTAMIYDGNMITRKNEWFCFDGKTSREVRERTKHVIDREIFKEGSQIDPFELGKGPFPLPFGQVKADMIKNFTITMGKTDPKAKKDKAVADTDHLVLIPKPKSRLAGEYKRIEYWLGKKDYMPRRILTEHFEDNTITVTFSKIKTNIKFKPKDLWVPVPTGYSHETEVLTD